MPDAVYDLAIQLSFAQIGVASGIAAAMSGFKQLSQQASAAEEMVGRLDQRMAMQGMSAAEQQAYRYSAALDAQTAAQQKLNDATTAFGKLLVGGALFTGGLMGIDLMSKAVSQAQQMQNAMTALSLATVGTLPSATLAQTIIDTAGKTQFSFAQVADIAKVAATNGLNNRTVLNAALPTLTNVAEIDNRLRGIAPDQSAAASVQIAHLFQSYPTNAAQAKAFTQLLDLAGRAQLVSGLSPDQMVRSVTQLAPARSTLGLSPQDIIGFSALAGNVGLTGGHGGASRLAAMFRTMVPRPGTLASKADAAIQSIAGAGSFFTGSGQFEGITNALNIVMQFLAKDKDQQQRIQLLTEAFGSAGSQAFGALSTPGAITRYKSIQSLLGPPSAGGLASTAQMQQGLNSTLTGQITDLKTNVASLGALFGTALIPPLTTTVGLLTKVVGSLADFGAQHKTLMDIAAWAVTFGSGLMVVSGAVLMVKGAWALLNLSGMVERIGAVADAVKGLAAGEAIATAASQVMAVGEGLAAVAAGALNLALAPEILAIGAVAVAVGALILVFKNWGIITDYMGGKIHDFLVWLGLLHDQTSATGKGPGGQIVVDTGTSDVTVPKGTKYLHYDTGKADVMLPIKHGKNGYYITPPKAGKGGTGGGSAPQPGNVHFHQGAIVVNGAAHHDVMRLATAVADEISKKMGAGHKWQAATPYGGSDLGWNGY